MALRWKLLMTLQCLIAWMTLSWELLMALAMIGSLGGPRWELFMALAIIGSSDDPSFGAFHDPCFSWELGWPYCYLGLCYAWELE